MIKKESSAGISQTGITLIDHVLPEGSSFLTKEWFSPMSNYDPSRDPSILSVGISGEIGQVRDHKGL